MRFLRREPLHARLAREGGLLRRPPLDAPAPPGWLPVGVHGVPRPREWDVVITAHAPGARGSEAQFVVLPGGRALVERGEGVDDLAAAAAGALEPPFRVEAVRRSADQWALGLRRIEVMELPELEGDELVVTARDGERAVLVDGEPVSLDARTAELLARDGDYVLEAVRIAGSWWEVRVSLL